MRTKGLEQGAGFRQGGRGLCIHITVAPLKLDIAPFSLSSILPQSSEKVGVHAISGGTVITNCNRVDNSK